MSSYSSVTGHMSMVYDDVRNAAYAAALRRYVNRNSVVLDLGSGLGIHGLIAAAQGARHVYLVDPSRVTSVAARVASENGVADKVTCIQRKIEDAELPEKVDLIVSVFIGNFLLEEDLLPSLFYARDKYLNTSGVLLPDRAEMLVVPVSAPEYHLKNIGKWSEPSQGIIFSQLRTYAANSLFYNGAKERLVEFLANPAAIASVDFASATTADCSKEVAFEATKSGECHGCLGWFRMRLGGNWLSTSPDEPATHWSQVFLPFDPPIEVNRYDRIAFKLHRPQFGEWTWTLSHKGDMQRHSTFFSRALEIEKLRRLAKNHPIKLNSRGELAEFVISQMNGVNTVGKIAQLASDEFGDRVSTRDELMRQVQSIFAFYGE